MSQFGVINPLKLKHCKTGNIFQRSTYPIAKYFVMGTWDRSDMKKVLLGAIEYFGKDENGISLMGEIRLYKGYMAKIY